MKAFTCTPLYPLGRPRALALWSSPTHARRHDFSSQRCSKHRKQPKEPRDDLFSRNAPAQDAGAPLTHDSQHMSRCIQFGCTDRWRCRSLLTIFEQPLSLHPQSHKTPKDKDSEGGKETDQDTDQVPHLQRLWVDEVGDLTRWRRQRDILICGRRHGGAKRRKKQPGMVDG